MRLGATNGVKALYTYPTASGTQFTDGELATWNLGLRSVKAYCTGAYLTDYPGQTSWSSTPTTLTELVQTTQFTTMLARAWEVVALTCFPFTNPQNNWWRVDASSARLSAEYTEMYNLAVHLLTTYNGSGKTFILQTWEGDWALMDVAGAPDTRVPFQLIRNYAAFLNVRQRAVSDARRNTAHANVTVLNAVEVNRVADASLPHRRRILTDLAKRINPDVVSYSAYDGYIDGLGYGADQAAWDALYAGRLARCIRRIKRAFPNSIFVVGEVGLPENEIVNEQTSHNTATMLTRVMQICEDEGASHLFFWQVFDNEASGPYTVKGYFLIKPDGSESLQADAMQAF